MSTTGLPDQAGNSFLSKADAFTLFAGLTSAVIKLYSATGAMAAGEPVRASEIATNVHKDLQKFLDMLELIGDGLPGKDDNNAH